MLWTSGMGVKTKPGCTLNKWFSDSTVTIHVLFPQIKQQQEQQQNNNSSIQKQKTEQTTCVLYVSLVT